MPGESHRSPREIQNYLNRVSGPLLDRIDIHVEVPAVKFREITAEWTGETSCIYVFVTRRALLFQSRCVFRRHNFNWVTTEQVTFDLGDFLLWAEAIRKNQPWQGAAQNRPFSHCLSLQTSFRNHKMKGKEVNENERSDSA